MPNAHRGNLKQVPFPDTTFSFEGKTITSCFWHLSASEEAAQQATWLSDR